MTDAGLAQRRSGSFCDKIVRRHQDRLAIVYVRQSTAQQVERHQESTKLRYALADRAAQFGWLREQIVVIDDDLGRSGASVEGPARRTGAGRGRRCYGKGSCRVSLAWRRPHDARADAPGRSGRVTEHLRSVDGARRGTSPRRPRMREDRRDPQCRSMAPGQAPRHLQCANGSSSPAQIRGGNDQVSPATATNRASGERMDDPRTRGRDRHTAADPLHLGPEGTPILPQRRLRLETRRARARRTRDDRGIEGDPGHPPPAHPPPWRRLPPKPADSAAAPATES